jgi:hypothetical protein
LILIQRRRRFLEHNSDHDDANQWKDHSVAQDAGQSPHWASQRRAEQSDQAKRPADNQSKAYDRFLASTPESESRKQQR